MKTISHRQDRETMKKAPAGVPALSEEEEDRLPILLRILNQTGPDNTSLYLGNRIAACDPELLLSHNITATLNLAVNISIPPLSLEDGTEIRRTHIGLIDGEGNTPSHLLSCVLALDGIIRQTCPGKLHYPAHRHGNILVHCRGGRSRSVTVLALYLHWSRPELYPSVHHSLDYLRKLRNIGKHHPHPALMTLADHLLNPGLSFREIIR